MTLEERAQELYLAQTDLSYRALFNRRCAEEDGIVYFTNCCLWVYEPRGRDGFRDIPALTLPFEEEFLLEIAWAMAHGESRFTEKTRDMRVTWSILRCALHRWLFKSGDSGLLGSITEDKIDSKNDPDTLFFKLDYMIESLKVDVPWLYPEGYAPTQPHRTHMHLFNPATRSVIDGEVAGPHFGRSGRRTWIFPDEFHALPYQAQAWASSSRTSDCRLPAGTPQGMNFAGQMANPGVGKTPSIKVLTLHWIKDDTKNAYELRGGEERVVFSGHGIPPIEEAGGQIHIGKSSPPPKNAPNGLRLVYPWYEKACADLNYDPTAIAQELNIDYLRSVEGQMYPQIEFSRVGFVPFLPSLKLWVSMDFGRTDMTALVWWQFDPQTLRFRIIDHFKASGHRIHWYIPFITGSDTGLGESEGGYNALEMAIIARHYAYRGHYTDFFGDPAGKQRDQVSNTSVISTLADYGIHVRTNDRARAFSVRKDALARILPFTDISEEYCLDLVQDIRDSREKNGTPVHGPESHVRTAMEFFAVNQDEWEGGMGLNPLTHQPLDPAPGGSGIVIPPAGANPRDFINKLAQQMERQWGRRDDSGYDYDNRGGY
jgi:hypothetical protein